MTQKKNACGEPQAFAFSFRQKWSFVETDESIK